MAGPEFTEIVERRANNGESFGPHFLIKERSNTSNAVAGDAILRPSRLELPLHGKLEKTSGEELNVVQKSRGHAVVGDLERSPRGTSMAHKSGYVGIGEVNERQGFVGGGGGEEEIIFGGPRVRHWE